MRLFRRKKKGAVPKESSRNKDSDSSNIQESEPSAKSALGYVVDERKSRAKPWYGIPSQADPSGRIPPLKNPYDEPNRIKPYNPEYNVNNDPRLKSIQSRIDSITSQISYAESNLPDGGAFFTDEFLGTVLGETERRTQYTVDEQRRDHAEARIQDLYGKKSDLKMQYELEQEKISIAYVAEYERKRASYYRKEIERVGGTPEQVKSLKTAYGIE